MKIDILTLFPEMFKGPFAESIVGRAQNKSLVEINIYNLRKWTDDKRGTVDDRPYGGGVGMVLMIEPIAKALEEIKSNYQLSNSKQIPNSPEKFATQINRASNFQKTKTILLSPRGKVWKQELAQEYSQLDHLILICGHYEGVDERVSNFIDEEISIGDFVLTGGEIPAMAMVDSIVRLIPSVLEKPQSTQLESFSHLTSHISHPILEYPQYTHPEDFHGLKVPKILLSGNHGEIEKWRENEALKITKEKRPDLFKK